MKKETTYLYIPVLGIELDEATAEFYGLALPGRAGNRASAAGRDPRGVWEQSRRRVHAKMRRRRVSATESGAGH